MKTYVMCVLAVVLTASSLTAQDTLTVRSERIVDVCSSERRWLIAPTLGRVNFQDSLMSFDITIGYDTLVTRPTDVLTEGTLSANLDFKPTLNTVVKGEMRIAGFNIITPMVGDRPIVAVAGNFLGSCTSVDSMSIPWPVSFNSEFKKVVTVYRVEPIVAVARARRRVDVGTSIDNDSVKIYGKDSTAKLEIRIALPGLVNAKARATIEVSDSSVVAITGIKAREATIEDVVVMSGGKVEVLISQTGASQPILDVTIKNGSVLEKVETTAKTRIELVDTCTCISAGLTDSVRVICENPMVSVLSSVDKHNDNLKVSSLGIRCYCDYGQTNSISVFATSGQLVSTTGELVQPETFLSIESLPSGAYIVVGNCGGKRVVTMEIK